MKRSLVVILSTLGPLGLLTTLEASQGSPSLEKGDTLVVTEASGDVIRGVLRETSADGKKLTLTKAERFTLAERIRSIPDEVTLVVTLRDGTGLRAPLAEAGPERFALWVRPEEKGHSQRVKRFVAYEEVYAVFHEGKLALGRGVELDAVVVELADTRQVERTRSGAGGKGALVGLLVGAGIAAVAAVGCCGNPDVGPAGAFLYMAPVLGGAGAGIGYFVGRFSGGGLEIVHWQAPSAPKGTLSFGPMAAPGGLGLALSFRF